MNRWKKNRFARPAINVEDVIDYVYDFFSDFKKKLKFNRFDRINMEVPRLIISKFKELFEIWDNNLMVSKCLEKDLFEEVYTTMADVFENYSSDSSDLTWFSCDGSSYLECKQCGEEIVLRNNNREYSVAYHNASRQHLDFVENIEKVRNEREIDPVERGRLECDEEIVLHDDTEPEIDPVERECLKCDECDEEIVSKDDTDDALAVHKKSLLHWELVNEKKIDTIEFISQVINEQGVTVKCHLCSVTISIETSNPNPNSTKYPTDIIKSHTNGENHVLNSYWFGLQSSHIKVHNKDENLIKCTLCDEIFVLDSFHDHFYAGSTSQHGRRMLLASINADNLRKSVGKMKIYYITRLKTNEGVFMKCHICHVLIRAITSTSKQQDRDIDKYLADAVNMHQETEDHILNLYWFDLQNCYVKVHDRKENLIECTLCDEIFRLDLFHNHFYAGSNSQHRRRTLLSTIDPANLKKSLGEMKIDCINEVENNAGTFMRCHICRVLIPTMTNNDKSTNKYLIDVVNLHQQDEDHLLNLYWLQLQSHYIEVYDRKQNIIRCTLCDKIFHLDSFYEHFYGGSIQHQHGRRMLLAAINDKRANKSSLNVLLTN